jgi:organic radical activating enzyme
MADVTPHIYLTLKCNGCCSYCSNICPTDRGIYDYNELPWQTWAKVLERLSFPSFVFTGGEPFLYYGIGKVLASLTRPAWVYSNLSVPLAGALDNPALDPTLIGIRASYHPHLPWSQFIDNIKYLEKRKIKTTVHVVMTQATMADMRSNLFRKHGLELKIEYDQRLHTRKKGLVACCPRSIIIAPDGNLFHCVSRMIRYVKPETLAAIDLGRPVTICDEPGACCPCDLASSYQQEVKRGA